jgi:hypothetical protein
MGLFHSLRMRMYKRSVEKALRNQAGRSRSVNLDQAHVIGVLFDATELSRRRAAVTFADKLQEQGKLVFKLGYFHSRQSDSNFAFKHFNKSQLDWIYRPRSREVDEFLGRKFDMLINLDPQTRPHSEYLAAKANARLKVGPRASRLDIYDLMVEASRKGDSASFVKQVAEILEKTNKRHEETEI